MQTAVSVLPFYCDNTKRCAGATMQTSALSAAAISVSLFHIFCLLAEQETSLAAAVLAQFVCLVFLFFVFFDNDSFFSRIKQPCVVLQSEHSIDC